VRIVKKVRGRRGARGGGWTADIIHMTEEMLEESEKQEAGRKYFAVLAIFLVVSWILYDFVLVGSKKFLITQSYSFEGKTTGEIADSLEKESRRLLSGAGEIEQIAGFVHLIERSRYLLYTGEVRLESYYDFTRSIMYPRQEIGFKDKSQYAVEVSKYLRRVRKTQYEYVKYEFSDPGFYYEDFTRNARVSVVRTARGGSKEYYTYHFREYRGRYYLYPD